MLLSLSWRFVFLSNMKAGSTSVEHALCEYAELQRIFPRNSKHFSMAQIAEAFPGVFSTPGYAPDQFVKFGVIRDPRDWICSWFNYRSRAELADPDHGQHDQFLGNLSFAEFAQEVVRKRPRPFGYVRRQASILADQGVPNCDYIVRFERFDEDMSTLVSLLGLPVTWIDVRQIRNRTAAIRLRAADVEWQAYPELLSFLESDIDLHRRYLARQHDQSARVAEMRRRIEDASHERSRDAQISVMLRRHWESYAASRMYGPTLGVSPERAKSEVLASGIDPFFLPGTRA